MAFKIGDTVRLNSGGPLMTVTEVGMNSGKSTVWVTWFDKSGEPKRGFYPHDAVVADDDDLPMPQVE